MSSRKVCALSSELRVNEAKRVEIDGTPVALIRDKAGDVHALGDTCSHGDFSLSEGEIEYLPAEGGSRCVIECLGHGSQFDVLTGEPLTLPALEAVPVYETTVEGGTISVDIETVLNRAQLEM